MPDQQAKTSAPESVPSAASMPAQMIVVPTMPTTTASSPFVIQVIATPDPDGYQKLTALSTPLLALLAGYIAWRQWKTANEALKKDLFEKRFAIYEATRQFLGAIALTKTVTPQQLGTFHTETLGARWLFNDKLADQLQLFYDRAVELASLESQIAAAHPPDKQKLRDEHWHKFHVLEGDFRHLNATFKDVMPRIVS